VFGPDAATTSLFDGLRRGAVLLMIIYVCLRPRVNSSAVLPCACGAWLTNSKSMLRIKKSAARMMVCAYGVAGLEWDDAHIGCLWTCDRVSPAGGGAI